MLFQIALFVYWPAVLGDKNGGVGCAGCVVIASWAEQYSSFHQLTGEEGLRDICAFFPTDLATLCQLITEGLGPYINDILNDDDLTVDTVCHCLGFCFSTEGYNEVCHLLPLPDYAQTDIYEKCPKWTQKQHTRHIVQLIIGEKYSDLIKAVEVHHGRSGLTILSK